MKKLTLLLRVLACGFASAKDGRRPLSGKEIAQVLRERKLQYRQAWHVYRASGRTRYDAGQDSRGYWAVRGNQYCSVWPPSDVWSCYDMARSGLRLIFTGASGDITDAVYADD